MHICVKSPILRKLYTVISDSQDEEHNNAPITSKIYKFPTQSIMVWAPDGPVKNKLFLAVW